MDKIAPYYKALVGFIAPGAVLIGNAVLETSQRGSEITQAEWVAAIVACIITSGAVLAVPNKDPNATHQAESVQPPERGAVDVLTVVIVVILVVILLAVLGFIR